MDTAPTQDNPARDEEISLLELLIVLAKHKRMVIGLPLVAAVIAAGISMLMPNVYTATTRILPPQQQQSSAAAMLGQPGALAGGAGAALGIKNPNDLYMGMLNSRTLADSLIQRFKLTERYGAKKLDDARSTLGGLTSVSAGKDGIISISVDDKDPKFAAELANAYVDELYKFTQTLAITEASQRRLFFEKQLKQAKDELANAEVAFKQTQERTGVLELDAQGKAMIESLGAIRAQIAAKEVELGALKTFATEQNPEYILVQQQLSGLRAQLAKLEHGGESGLIPTGKLPEAGLENIRRLRDVKYYETLYELMAKQYEIARVDEAKNVSMIQVLDKAVPPDYKTKPKRSMIVMLTAVTVGFLAILIALLRESMSKPRRSPELNTRIERLSASLKWR
ncbi:MAG: Wzz/FepE/Etk N-terminal domain-containing protein [Pseudomonadota bacterium]